MCISQICRQFSFFLANQETIVELMGFVRRVFPEMKSQKQTNLNVSKPLQQQLSAYSSTESLPQTSTKIGSTQLTFDFHRLNVLLLRGIAKDGFVVGKKICTATMSEAKIQAVVGNLHPLFIFRNFNNSCLSFRKFCYHRRITRWITSFRFNA